MQMSRDALWMAKRCENGYATIAGIRFVSFGREFES